MLQAHPMAWIADWTWPGDGMEWNLTQVRAHRQCTDREGWLMRTSEMEGGRACIFAVSNLSKTDGLGPLFEVQMSKKCRKSARRCGAKHISKSKV